MITNLLIAALGVGLAYLVSFDAQASRRMQPVRVTRHDRVRRQDPARRD